MMFRNHLKIAFRNLKRNKINTLITLLGLSIGIASVLLIFRMLDYELSFNKNFAEYDRLVRVVSVERTNEGEEGYSTCIPIPAMKAMKTDIPQFEKVSLVRELWSNVTVPNPDGGAPLKKFGMEAGQTAFFASVEFLEIFDFPLLAGNKEDALSNPDAIVLTKTLAEKCFGTWKKAMDQVLMIDNIIPVKVSAVLEDLPTNCDFSFPYLVAYPLVESNPEFFLLDSRWGSCSSNNQVYAMLYNNKQEEAANAALTEIGKEEYANQGNITNRVHQVQAMSDLHFSKDYSNSGTHRISKDRLRILGAIGVLILILACFNFINLTTAQATLRAKEVGVRKTLGGQKIQLVAQFMTETGLVVSLAAVLGLLLAYTSLPLLQYVSDVPDHLAFLSKPIIWWFLGGMTILVTLLAGLYPSFILSGFKPINALKSNMQAKQLGGVSIRKSLVLLQFVIAQALVVGAIITILQLEFIRSHDLGFSKDLIYTFQMGIDESSVSRQSALKNKLLQIPEVESVSFSSDQPISGNTWTSSFSYANRPEGEAFPLSLKFTDEDYMETYGLKLDVGRWLNPSDTIREAVVNKKLLDKLGVPDSKSALNEKIQMGRQEPIRIVGVVENFHTHNLREKQLPLLMSTLKAYYWEVGVKLRSTNPTTTSLAIKKVYDEVLPEQVFSGVFLDESIEAFYESDNRLAAACKGFGFLAILISCLGLFGLATHATAQRVKEIGIRKVLGASVASIVSLLSREFLILVLIAFVVAAPIAYYFMEEWLKDFEYRMNTPWLAFPLAGLLALIVAFLTVSFQSLKAAIANPIKALRSE